jgi:hypothetical protein
MGLTRLLKLLLWLQFLLRGMVAPLLRYYGTVWLSAAVVVAGSIGLMLNSSPANATSLGPVWRMLTLCAVSIPVAYLFARFLGPAPIAAICIALPGIFIITPQRSGSAQVAIETRSEDGIPLLTGETILSTGDPFLFVKGAFVSSLLLAASYLAIRVLPVLPGMRRWSLRWTTTLAILIVGIGALELLREVTGVFPQVRMPWQPLTARILREAGWPKSICIWIWLDIAILLAMYEDRLIPYLLHRTGHQWAPSQLSLQDAFVVDSLVSAIADLRRKGDDRDRSHSSRPTRSRRR